MVFNFLLLLLYLLNLKLSLGLTIQSVEPLYLPIQRNGGKRAVILIFDESVVNQNLDLTLRYTGGEWEITLKRSNSPSGENNPNKAYFYFDHNDFYNKKLFGYYQLYYGGDGGDKITTETEILIYLNSIRFKNPKDRYFLMGNGQVNCTFELFYPIIKEEIYRISLNDGQTSLNNCTYYLEDEGSSLIISLNKPSKIRTYIFSVYPIYDQNTNSPSNLTVYFQNFYVHYEAVYANASAESTSVSILIDFVSNTYFGVNFILEYSGSGSVTFRDNGFSRDDHNNIFYSFTLYNPSPGIININYNNQVRPIFLITYQTNSNKCYITGANKFFEIKFFKIEEMEYTHSVIFDTEPNQGLRLLNEGSNEPIYTHEIKYLYQGHFHLYSRISKLSSSDANPIDIPSLNVTIYNDPLLEDNSKPKTLYIKINQPQYLTLNISGAGNVNEIFLVSPQANKEIKLLLSDCETINDIYNCSNIANQLVSLDESYISDDYEVLYTSTCDNQRLKINNKKVIIRKGYDLLDAYPNWTFIDNLVNTNFTVRVSEVIEGNFNILFCFRNDLTNCYGTKEIQSNRNIITINLGSLMPIEQIYSIILLVNGQIVQNNDLIFKVIPRLKFNFNHQYFVKDNGAENNYLNLTKNFNENDNIIYIIRDDLRNNLTTRNNRSFIYNIYNIDFLGVISFSYFDNDIEVYIPISNTIYVANTINELFSLNLMECYYYKFKLAITKRNGYTFTERIFLDNNNKDIEFEISSNNEYKLKLENENDIKNLIGKEFNFYISEKTIDKNIYLYKSKFAITNIGVPEYIIYPNTSLYFSSVTCDLCDTKFQIISYTDNRARSISQNCRFHQNSLTATSNFNYDYNYFRYSLDDENITNIDNNLQVSNTFHSNQLSRSRFTIDIDSETNQTHLLIKITNTNRDFYFNLISNLTIYQVINGKNKSLILNTTSPSNEFKIIDNEISFVIRKGNFELDINHLTRRRDSWETVVDSSFYYYFGSVTKYNIFDVKPTVFASHDFSNKDLVIDITFNNGEIRNSFKAELNNLCEKVDDINNQNVQCQLSRENIQTSKKLQKSFADYTIEIDLIYYNLSSPSKCVALEQQGNTFDLIIYVPDEYYTYNNIYLKSNIYPKEKYTQTDFTKTTIKIPIDVIIADNIKYDFYVDDKLIESFYLKEFDINFIPKFEFRETGTNIILLPEQNQMIKLTYSQNDQIGSSYSDSKENKNNITSFQIGNITNSTNIDNDNDNIINVYFNLSPFTASQTNYNLSYFDTCGNKINTGIKIRILSFYFERHYFVLNNNNNQQAQNLRIQGPINNQIELYIIDDRGDNLINPNGNIYNYQLDKSGNYSFYYINNNVRSNLTDKVIVVDKLSDLFEIKTNLTECMFYNISKYLRFSYTFIYERIANSFFNMTLKIEGDNQNYSLISINNNNLEFMLTYNNFRNRISQNQNLIIYFYENNDMAQPLYKYNYKYTNITLNSRYEDVIYSDAIYILFNMSCQINALEDFYLYEASSPTTSKGAIKCKDFGTTSINNVYNCTLYENNNNYNPINDLSKFKYDYYIMKYDSEQVSLKEFFISKDILNSDFNLEKEEEILTDRYTTLKINSSKNEFYLPYLNYLLFLNISSGATNPLALIPIRFNDKFNKTNNYYQFSLYLKNKRDHYNLTSICRKNFNYCRNGECKTFLNRDDYQIIPNIPDISLIFNRRYISLEDSLYNNEKNSSLIITFDGEDKDTLTNLKYLIYTSLNNNPKEVNREIPSSSNNFIIENPEKGMYKFLSESYLRPNKYIDKDYKVFVVNKDNELLNINYLNDNCIYYDSNERVLFTTLILNNNYIFRNNALETLNYLQIYYGGQIFNYINGSYGYKLQNPSYTINCDNDYEFSIIENSDYNYAFTKLTSKKNCTSPNFNDGYYKDNIPLTFQRCVLNNIYLADKNSPNSKTKLDCHFFESEEELYCNINPRKFDRPNIDFDIYFNYGNNYLKSDRVINIYNSINDSQFDLSYSEPSLSISSLNFDMTRIEIVDIDNKSYVPNYTGFVSKDINNVTFIYFLNNVTSYVTKLTRMDHDKDRNVTIKYKNLSQEIKEMNCSEFEVPYQGLCIDCKVLSENGLIEAQLKWTQDHKCVAKCDYDNEYAIYDSKNYYCRKCAEKTKIDSQNDGFYYVCSCLAGTVKSFENNICYLPEDDEIARLRNIQTRAQCYQASGKEHNYCSNHTTTCNVENKNGYLFPFCYCEDGYTGRYCEFEENNFNLSSELDEVLSNNNEIEESDITAIAKIRGITYFFEEQGNKNVEQFKSIDKIDIYIKSSLDIIDKIKNFGKNTVSQIFDVMELAIYFLKERILYHRNLRNLQEENNYREDLNKILNNLHYLNVKANWNHTGNFKIQTDKLYLSTFIVYKKNDLSDASFLEEMSNNNYFKIMEYANISETDVDDKIFVTLINSSLFDEEEKSSSENFGVKAYFSTTNDTNGTNTLMDKRNIIFYISSSAIHFNFDLAEYYSTKNIIIYDKNDEAFTDPCFLSKDFDFDLTQKYRKNNVYQKITFGNDVCKYVKFEYEYNKYSRLIFECNNFSYFNNISELQYGMLEFNFKRDSVKDADKVYNLPTKCTNKIDNIGDNWAFWFFLILCLFEIIYCIGLTILNFGSLKKVSYRKGLIHDQFYQIIPFRKNLKNEDMMSNSEQLAKGYIKPTIKNTNVREYDLQTDNISDIASEGGLNKSFWIYLRDNFKELHPLATLCRVSLISPLILNSIFFVFNILILFGFNALLYYESLIEKRIYKINRNNFDYPMLIEFHKIILSILCQIALCVIAKLILLVTPRQKDALKENLRKCYKQEGNTINNEIVVKIDQFQDDIFWRRIISAAFMTVIIVFFFYYSVAFCGVYIQTQRNWFYSGIWSLFWNWVIFAPIYIVIISFLEFKKNEPDNTTMYYLKRLFFF